MEKAELIVQLEILQKQVSERLDALLGALRAWTPREYVVDVLLPPSVTGVNFLCRDRRAWIAFSRSSGDRDLSDRRRARLHSGVPAGE